MCISGVKGECNLHSCSHPSGAQNKFAKFLLSCMKCCFWCLEKCIKFLNRNAYIMVSSAAAREMLHLVKFSKWFKLFVVFLQIAIYGKSFCPSARDAFFLLMRNIIRWDFITLISTIFNSMSIRLQHVFNIYAILKLTFSTVPFSTQGGCFR